MKETGMILCMVTVACLIGVAIVYVVVHNPNNNPEYGDHTVVYYPNRKEHPIKWEKVKRIYIVQDGFIRFKTREGKIISLRGKYDLYSTGIVTGKQTTV